MDKSLKEYGSTIKTLTIDTFENGFCTLKLENKGVTRKLVKQFLNNLYGKSASNNIIPLKYCYMKEDKTLGFILCVKDFTVKDLQEIFKRGFIYVDTDRAYVDASTEKERG